MSWFAFDIDEYDADTMHLTLAQDGAYMRLLRFYYKTRLPLPDNDHALANIARTSIEEWDTMKTVLRAFFKSRRGRLHSKRADRELDREDSLARKRSDKAKNAAEKRHNKPRAYVLRADTEHVPSKDTVMLGDATRPDQTRPIEDSAPKAPRKRVASLSAEQSKLFDEWWQVWPVKQGKEPAKLAFLAALSRGATVPDLTAGARRYAEVLAAPDPPRPKFPQGWLNDSRWLDEMMPNGHANGRTDGSGGIPPIQPIQPSGPRSPPPRYILPPQ